MRFRNSWCATQMPSVRVCEMAMRMTGSHPGDDSISNFARHENDERNQNNQGKERSCNHSHSIEKKQCAWLPRRVPMANAKWIDHVNNLDANAIRSAKIATFMLFICSLVAGCTQL